MTETELDESICERKYSTQSFELRRILIDNCGKTLTPDVIDEITSEMIKAMREGPCSWAFA